MKITIIAVGKPKNRHLDSMAKSYIERAGKFVSVSREIVKDDSSGGDIERIKDRETENVMKKIRSRDFVALLDEKGITMDSMAFSRWLSARMENVQGRIVFVIGGAHGVSDSLHERANMLLSLSLMTFPHELCQVFLAEQVYRAVNINAGTSYHH